MTPAGSGAEVLVLCRANVCRSVFAAALLSTRLGALGIRVSSAGLEATSALPACTKVDRALHRLGTELDAHAARPCTEEDLERADLILVMTREQGAQASRRALRTRERTYTLASAAALAESVATSGQRVASLAALVSEIGQQRGRVRIPAPAVPRRVAAQLRRRGWPISATDILDGHTSGSDALHEYTLTQVKEQSERLLTAFTSTLPTPSSWSPATDQV